MVENAVHSHLLVYPTPAVPHPLPEAFFESAPASHLSPQRVRFRCFSFLCLHHANIKTIKQRFTGEGKLQKPSPPIRYVSTRYGNRVKE